MVPSPRLLPILPLLCLLPTVPPAPSAETPSDPAPAAEPASREAVQQEAAELLAALQAYTAERRDELDQQVRASLATLDRRIQTLQTQLAQRWNEMDQLARSQAQQRLEALREQRDRVATWFAGMTQSSGTAWERMKQGFTEAYRELDSAWRESEAAIEPQPEESGHSS